jgi:hypothetical protein
MDAKEIVTSILADVATVTRGEKDALRVFIGLKRIEKTLKYAFEAIESEVFDECDKYDPRELKERGITVQNGKRIWNYKDSQEWLAKKAELIEIEEQLQARALLPQSQLIDGETGELLEKASYTLSKRSITVSKKILEV